MALCNKCKKSYRDLILKRVSLKIQVYGKKHFLNTQAFERLFFFLARQSHPSINQVIFQKHYFNDTTHHNNLYILCQKAMELNMYEMMNLTKTFDSVPHSFFIAQLNIYINFYHHRVCKENIICNWKKLSFAFLCKLWVSALIYLLWVQILKWIPDGFFSLMVNF